MEVAAGLTTIGVERGDFVALMMDNRVEHVIADQATLHAGGADDRVEPRPAWPGRGWRR
jgi:long-subunit acyl-CoA synthetase (AMP-forming)